MVHISKFLSSLSWAVKVGSFIRPTKLFSSCLFYENFWDDCFNFRLFIKKIGVHDISSKKDKYKSAEVYLEHSDAAC